MKKIILTFIVLTAAISAASAQGQTLYRTSYFMEGSTMRNAMNPAFRPYRGYVNIPVLGNFGVDINMKGGALSTYFYPHANGSLVGFWDEAVTWDRLSAKLGKNNGLDAEVNTSVLGFGFYSGPSFWSFSLDLKANAGFNAPKEMFAYLKEGSGTYDASGLSLGAESRLSASLGYSRRIFSNLTVGGRVNFLGGLARANMNFDKFILARGLDGWSVAGEGTLDLAENALEISNAVDDEGYIDLENIKFKYDKFRGLAGTGLSFDIGAEYVLLDRITFSLSLLDMGFMRWNSSLRGESEDQYTIKEFGTDLKDLNVNEMFRFRSISPEGRAKGKLQPTFVFGAEYDILGDKLLGVGVLYTNKGTLLVGRQSDLSFAFTVRPINWFTASINFLARQNKAHGGIASNLGMAINFHPSWINFFVGADFMVRSVTPKYFIPVSQDRLNVYLGLAVPLGREKVNVKSMSKLGI